MLLIQNSIDDCETDDCACSAEDFEEPSNKRQRINDNDELQEQEKYSSEEARLDDPGAVNPAAAIQQETYWDSGEAYAMLLLFERLTGNEGASKHGTMMLFCLRMAEDCGVMIWMIEMT
jgi:hypothetical protein